MFEARRTPKDNNEKKYKKQCSITGAVNSEPVGSMAFKMEDRSDNLN